MVVHPIFKQEVKYSVEIPKNVKPIDFFERWAKKIEIPQSVVDEKAIVVVSVKIYNPLHLIALYEYSTELELHTEFKNTFVPRTHLLLNITLGSLEKLKCIFKGVVCLTKKIEVMIELSKVIDGMYILYGETNDIRNFDVVAGIPCVIDKQSQHNKGLKIHLLPDNSQDVYTFTVAQDIFNDDKDYFVYSEFCGRGTFEVIIIDCDLHSKLLSEPILSTKIQITKNKNLRR